MVSQLVHELVSVSQSVRPHLRPINPSPRLYLFSVVCGVILILGLALLRRRRVQAVNKAYALQAQQGGQQPYQPGYYPPGGQQPYQPNSGYGPQPGYHPETYQPNTYQPTGASFAPPAGPPPAQPVGAAGPGGFGKPVSRA